MPHGVKSARSIAKRKASRQSKQRKDVGDSKIPGNGEAAELEKVPGSGEAAELEKVPGDGEEAELEKAPGNSEAAELEKVPGDSEEAELEKVPGDGEEAELEKAPGDGWEELEKVPGNGKAAELEKVPGDGGEAELDREERIFKAVVVDGALARESEWRARDQEMRFWRGGFADEADFAKWDEDGPSPTPAPPRRSPSPGFVVAFPSRKRVGSALLAGRGLKVLRSHLPKWSDKDQVDSVHQFFDEAARRSGIGKSELLLQLRLEAMKKKP